MKYETKLTIYTWWPFVAAALLFTWMLCAMYGDARECERMGGQYGCRHVWVELVDAEGQKNLESEMRCMCTRKDQK